MISNDIKFKKGDFARFKRHDEGLLRIEKVVYYENFDYPFYIVWFYDFKRISMVYFTDEDLDKIENPTTLMKILFDVELE